MSNRWPGGLIRKTPVTPTGPLQTGAAPGMWTLAEASYWTKQGLWPLAGNTLAVEDVFSTYLYTGTGAAQTITNGINVSGQGGMVWLKMRSPGSGWSSTQSHALFDTVRGDDKYLCSNLTDGQFTFPNNGITFNSSGFGIDAASYFGGSGDQSTSRFASWTFREAPNFFDVVTYTGNGTSQNIAHNLGSVPGMIIVKRTDAGVASSFWAVYHRSLSSPSTNFLRLNTTDAQANYGGNFISGVSSTNFTVSDSGAINESGGTYVAYLYAHDTASTGLIQCGSFTTDGSGAATVTLGWEPQWLMAKSASLGGPWVMTDIMRGMTASGVDATLLANSSAAEGTSTIYAPTATGFTATNLNGSTTYTYVAIRRGPMRTPTLGTSVFSPNAVPASQSNYNVVTNFPVDLAIGSSRSAAGGAAVLDRLRGGNTSSTYRALYTTNTNAEASGSGAGVAFDYNDRIIDSSFFSGYSFTAVYWNFRRAPGFFDEVCYTGTGVARTLNHNLGVVPELMIVKARSVAGYGWFVYAAPQGATKFGRLDLTNAFATASTVWNDTAPTASVFSLGAAAGVNDAYTYVAYLFASAPGVSKVGSYTGTGTTQTVNCGFTTGARFVLIKRTDSTGDWYVWDSARGIVAGNDPYLLLNSTAAEVTSTDYVDTDNSGFQLSSTAPAALNANGGTYIFLAIA